MAHRCCAALLDCGVAAELQESSVKACCTAYCDNVALGVSLVATKIYEDSTCAVVYEESACVCCDYCTLNGSIACTCSKNLGDGAYLGRLGGLIATVFTSFALACYECYIVYKERCTFTVFVIHNVYGNLGCCVQCECESLLFPLVCCCLSGGVVIDVVLL